MAATKMHLSKARINALATPDKPLTVHDAELGGFELLVLPSGTRTFYLHGRTRAGRQYRFKLGRFGTELTAEQARAEARRIRAAVALGQDPAADRQRSRQKHKVRQASPTVSELWEAFVEARKSAWSPNTLESYQAWFRNHVAPALGRQKAHEIAPVDIRRMYRAIAKPATQHQVLRCTSAMYGWAVAQDVLPLITVNPCSGAIGPDLKGPGANRREREPEGDELERMIRALETRDDLIGVFFVLLLLTGARENELLRATWREFDLDAERPVWRKPTSKTGKPHRVTLSDQAAELLRAVKAAQPFSPFGWLTEPVMRKVWRQVCAAAEVTDLRIHDWGRHFHASLLAAEGYSLLDIGKALGHRSEQTTKRYTHVVESRQREAAGKLGEVVRLAGRRP